ncbi:hypothetical protein JZ751_007410 [Albula glossodonta]|uniref:C2H2-type domain-containing protein n=1 Tax=Albula glossodonta TaxID=121402 RepID=A0A8T2N287_9TELE|nr:hypothetical protein JZ751_007410 [Albula glossodonta]
MHLPSHLQTRGGVLSEQEGGEKLYSSGRKGNGRSAAWEGGDAGLLEMMEIGIEGRQVSQRGKGGLESSAGEVSSEVGKEVWESGEMEQAHWSAVEAHEGEVAEGDKRAKGERCGGKRAGQTGEKIDKERLKLEDCPKRLGPQGQAFICPHCGLTVSSLFCLNLHLKTQHRKQATSMYLPGPGLNPCKRDLAGSSNRCHLCGRNFYSRSNLKKHMVVHSGRRPYSCPDCGRTFNQSSNVLRHQRSHHHALSSPNCHGVEGKGGEGMTSNRGTRQVRKRPQNMRVRVHREESIDIMNLGAERINKTLNKDLENTSAGQSASHIPFLCQVCGHGFPSHSSLEIHMLGHTTERPYRCPLCGRGFANTPNFTRHMLVHTGEKPWRCTDCGRCFNQISNLNRHCRSYGHQGSIAKGTPA